MSPTLNTYLKIIADTYYYIILQGLPLGHLSIIILKTSTIRLRNSSDPIGL